MHTMYTNLAKTQAFPFAIRVSSRPRCFKPFPSANSQSLHIGSNPKPLLNPTYVSCALSVHCSSDSFHIMNPIEFSTGPHRSIPEMDKMSKTKYGLTGVRTRSTMQCWCLVNVRSFSGSHTPKGNEGSNSVVRGVKPLPWLGVRRDKEVKWSERPRTNKGKNSSRGNPVNKSEKVSNRSSWEESEKRLERAPVKSSVHSSWRETSALARNFTEKADLVEDEQMDYIEKDEGFADDEEPPEKRQAITDPRWDRIKTRFRGVADVKDERERPELRRWNKQENWGQKTWKEATESTVPKMVGEGIYGVGPVLAALSAGRREFYALYVQEGLDLSSNNRKKKDKKGFEKVLRMAEKNGLSIKELSKHDLNMVTDNRPHQGLVLDASPLEMVKIKELDHVSVEEDKGSLWLALDEVTDPQNLGAIIRSAYFFGASGVVLCAKNSARLSGVVSKASAGSLELMELRYCKNMMQFLTSSAENGWRVLGGSVSSKAVPLKSVLPGEPTILVLGSEGTGLRPLVERSCTELVRIPGNMPVEISVGEVDNVEETTETNTETSGEDFRSFLAVESLNVSVAAGVLLHHLV